MKALKKVLFIATDFMQINSLVKNEMSTIYEVQEITYPLQDSKFKYKNKLQKVENFVQKTFLKNKNFKKELIQKLIEQNLIQQLDQVTSYSDYVFILNIEYFSNIFLSKLSEKGKKIVAYQWDGLSRTPEIHDKIKYCDTFYTFDRVDVDHTKIFFATNFFFENELKTEFKKEEYDLFYMGSFREERVILLNKLIEQAEKLQLKYKVIMYSYDKNRINAFSDSKITITNKLHTYYENLQKVAQAKVVIDLKLDVHNGLSFRFFECLYLKKKIITNNASILNYDFYHPNNIFVLNKNNMEEIDAFIKLPYVSVNEEIVDRYNFKNWIKNILENE